jgi:hypothetical protein
MQNRNTNIAAIELTLAPHTNNKTNAQNTNNKTNAPNTNNKTPAPPPPPTKKNQKKMQRAQWCTRQSTKCSGK